MHLSTNSYMMNTSGVSQSTISKTGAPVPQAVSVPGNMCKIISSGMFIHKANDVLIFLPVDTQVLFFAFCCEN